MGDFEKLQCTGEYCFCVDPKSGKEVPGTKKKREGNFILHCDDKGTFLSLLFLNWTGLVSTSAKAREDGQVLPVGREYCKMDRDRGHSCDVKSRSTMVKESFIFALFPCSSISILRPLTVLPLSTKAAVGMITAFILNSIVKPRVFWVIRSDQHKKEQSQVTLLRAQG